MFRIGEFSKIAQIPASLLRYYDEIDLFKPAFSDDESGYRYYRAEQIARINRIIALKGLGLSLEQVRDLVDNNISSEEIQGMLTLRKAQIKQNLLEETQRLQAVESRLVQISKGGALSEEDVLLKRIPAQPFISTRHLCMSLEETFAIIGNVQEVVAKHFDSQSLGQFVAVIHSEQFEEQNFDLEFGFTLTAPSSIELPLANGRLLSVRALEAIDCALTTVRTGGPEKGIPCYAAIGGFAEQNGFDLTGSGREVFLTPPTPDNLSELIVEIQYPAQANNG